MLDWYIRSRTASHTASCSSVYRSNCSGTRRIAAPNRLGAAGLFETDAVAAFSAVRSMPLSVCFFAFFCSSAALIIQPLVRPIANGTAAQVNETNSDDTDDDDDDDDDDSGGDAIVAVNFSGSRQRKISPGYALGRDVPRHHRRLTDQIKLRVAFNRIQTRVLSLRWLLSSLLGSSLVSVASFTESRRDQSGHKKLTWSFGPFVTHKHTMESINE